MRTQIIIDGAWVDGVQVLGEWYRQQVASFQNGEPVWQEQRFIEVIPEPVIENPIKKVGMAELGELLPDEVLVELIDYQNDTTALPAVRRGATRILTRVNSNQPVDVLNPDFINLLQGLVSFTSLTTQQATSIFNVLKA